MSSISGLPEHLLEVLGSLITQDMKPTWSLRRSSGQISVLVKWTTKFRIKTTSHKAMQCDLPSFTKLQTGELDIHTDRIPHQSVVITKSTCRSEPGKKKKSPSTRKRDHLRLIKWRASRHGKQQSNAPKPIHQEDGPVSVSTPPTTPIGNISVDNTAIPMEYEVNSARQMPPTLLTGKPRPTTPDSPVITSQNSTHRNQQHITETTSALTLREEGLDKLE